MARKRQSAPQHPYDALHGIETGGLIAAGELITGSANDKYVTAYYAVAPSILRSLIAVWMETGPANPIERYSFVDIGAGKGRAMLVASEFPFHQVIGVELNPEMADIAQRNLDRYARVRASDPTAAIQTPVKLFQQDAMEFQFPGTPCLAFLFHPFEAPLLRRLLRRMEDQFSHRVRELDVLYVNAECASVFDRNPAFKKLWFGRIPMSAEDHAADLAAIAQQREYGSTGDEECGVYRYVGRPVAEVW